MAEKTGYVTLNNLCKCIIDLYGREYLRKPNATDIARLYSAHEEKHGFKGMLGSIDCMHWAWKNCPVAWKGQYTRGDHGHPTIMLEAVASYDTWIWHAFFGMAGSNNDINVLNHSPLFDSIRKDRAAPSPFEVNGNHCIVMHNMIQEDNRFALSTWEQEWLDKPENRPRRNIRIRVKDHRSREKEIRDRDVHDQLREDLTAHIWNLPPNFRLMHN
ncbi:uncharacterized protein [Rutidosis leptorrhynchoides]|uniref:uncharacterized protein n=1 Tax=Rutidosis leptorrhynchoides TaxID=125765 RepID=UPI003A9A4D4E